MTNRLTEAELDEAANQITPKVDDFVANLNTANEKVINSMGIPKDMLKPPLGLKPRWLAEEERFDEVDEAIKRYVQANKKVPSEWRDEWNELYVKMKNHGLCVKFRSVVNDAVVGEWNDMPEIQPPTYDGIVRWMDKQGGFDLSLLNKNGGFDFHLVNYGLRQQFWVPNEEDFRKEHQEVQEGGFGKGVIQDRVVVCKDDCGDCGLTQGKEYQIVTYLDLGMVRVVNDKGIEQDYFSNRFIAEKPEKFFRKVS